MARLKTTKFSANLQLACCERHWSFRGRAHIRDGLWCRPASEAGNWSRRRAGV